MSIGIENVQIRTQMVHFADRVCVDGVVTGSLRFEDDLRYGDAMNDEIMQKWISEAPEHPFLDVHGDRMTYYATQGHINHLRGPYMNLVRKSGRVEFKAVE